MHFGPPPISDITTSCCWCAVTDFLKLPKSRQMKSFKATDAAFQFGLQEKGNKK